MKVQGGGTIPMVLVRTDIGCSDSKIHDKDYDWDPNKKTFFLNEIEPSSTTYFVRHLKFDCIPMYGRLYAESALKYKEQKDNNSTSGTKRSWNPLQGILDCKRSPEMIDEAEANAAKKAKGA